MIALLRTTLALALTVLLSWSGSTTATGATAMECEPLDLDDAVAVRASADAVTDVFVGRVKAVERRVYVGGGQGQADNQTDGPDGPRGSDPRMVRWVQQVDVQVQYRGTLDEGGRVVVVTDPGDEGGFGKLTDGGLYLFFVSADEGTDRLVAEACSGTQLLKPNSFDAAMRDLLEELLVGTEEPATPDYTLSTPDDGARSTPALGRLVAPGAAVALIGVLGLLLLGRAGSRRA